MALEVVLEQFSGPLDLLLHLIRKQEINIHDIPIALITEQYLEYLRAMEELSLEIASEFIVMAATLLAIKSRMLLPRPSKAAESEGEEEDPREELVQQLLEYERCKWAAEQLRERGVLQSNLFSRPPMDLSAYVPQEPPRVEGVSIWDLVDAYRKLLLRIPSEDRVAEIKGHVISVEERMETILARLRALRRSTFFELTQDAHTRPEVVASFLALLELMKARRIYCVQVVPFGDIEVVLAGEEAS
jgi:segregation and condensation protein A